VNGGSAFLRAGRRTGRRARRGCAFEAGHGEILADSQQTCVISQKCYIMV
jgi:hypothetical protein